jgi:EpsI family protein
MSRFRVIAVVALLAVTSAVHLTIHAAQDKAAGAAPEITKLDIPATIADFKKTGEDIDQGDRVREILQTSTILTRNYVSSGGWPVQLTIVYAGTTRGSLHFPEVCLVGQGFEIREQYSAPVGFLFTAKRLALVKGDRNEAVLYWFKTGDHFTGSYFLNTWYWVLGKLAFKAPSSSMIRLSTFIGSQGDDASFQVLEDFATKLAPILTDTLKD